MIDASLRILRADVAGMPIEWIGFEEAVKLHCLEQILYPMGSPLYTVHGGSTPARVSRARSRCTPSFVPSASHARILSVYLPTRRHSTTLRFFAVTLTCACTAVGVFATWSCRVIMSGRSVAVGVDKWQECSQRL